MENLKVLPTMKDLYSKENGCNSFISTDGGSEIFASVNRLGKIFLRVNKYPNGRSKTFNFDKNGYIEAIEYFTGESFILQKTCKIIETEHAEYDEYDRCTGLWHNFYCSICNYKFNTDCGACLTCFCGEKIQNHCPNCGAKITK